MLKLTLNLILFSPILFISSCISADESNFLNSMLCSSELMAGQRVDRISLEVYPDRHGAYATTQACPEKVFSLRFSNSSLYSDENKDLVERMIYSSSHGVIPIKLIVDGAIKKDEVGRVYIDVLKIHSYEKDESRM